LGRNRRRRRLDLLNYVNYFTEIERFYQCKRQNFTLLCTLDWILVETWKEQGVPLELVFKGIERAFSRARRQINSLAYCAKYVAQVCEEQKDLHLNAPELPDISPEEVSRYTNGLAAAVSEVSGIFPEFHSKFSGIAECIRNLDVSKLRETEQQLTALEEKLVALLKISSDESLLAEVKRDLDNDLGPYRSTMTAEQLTMIEQQLWRRKLMERFNIPRLSLFYLL
jgi:hypothetical protein